LITLYDNLDIHNFCRLTEFIVCCFLLLSVCVLLATSGGIVVITCHYLSSLSL